MTPDEDRRAGAERDRVRRAEGVEHDREVRAEGVESARAGRAFVVRKRDARFRVEVYVLYAVSIGLAMVSIALAFWVADVVAQINKERVHNTVIACQRDSAKNKAIVGFVADSIAASPRERGKLIDPEHPLRKAPYSTDPEMNAYLVRAIKTFPTFTDKECERRAAKQVQAG